MALPKQQSPSTVAEERLLRKQRLAAGFRIWGRLGYDEGPAGHITARDPELADHFWVNPFGKHFSLISVSDLLLVNHHGEVVEGDQPVNRAAFAIHSAIHAARPDVVAAAHCHSVHGKAWSSLGRLLDPITQDSCSFYEDHALFDDFTGVVLDVEEGKRIAHGLGERKALILRNHGLLTVGKTIGEAFNWMHRLELTARSQLAAMATGARLVEVPKKVLEETYMNYQPQTRRPYGVMEWPALLRMLDRMDPSFRE